MKPIKIDIIHEDDALIMVNKPAGVLSIPDRFDAQKPNLVRLLEQNRPKVWIVHRLDLETSGIICFAKTEAAHRELSRQFAQREVKKYYRLLVDGIVRPAEGVIDRPIAPSPAGGGLMHISAKGKPSTTKYQVLEVFKKFSWVEAQLLTGRTHQIRVHFKHLGHPLSVDRRYGPREAFFLSEIKHRRYNLGKTQEERPLLSRSALHAFRLTLQHPSSREVITLEAPLPKDLKAVLNQLRKWGR
ncbi:MAG: RluA family pseudouridine synthase [Bacteroidota bacterium]